MLIATDQQPVVASQAAGMHSHCCLVGLAAKITFRRKTAVISSATRTADSLTLCQALPTTQITYIN